MSDLNLLGLVVEKVLSDGQLVSQGKLEQALQFLECREPGSQG